jgi:hypothetical protein
VMRRRAGVVVLSRGIMVSKTDDSGRSSHRQTTPLYWQRRPTQRTMIAASVIQRSAYHLGTSFSSGDKSRSSLCRLSLANAPIRVKGSTSQPFSILDSNGHFCLCWKRKFSTDEAVVDRNIRYEALWNSQYEGMAIHIISCVM